MAIQPVTMDNVSQVTPTPATTETTTSSDTKKIQTQITSKQQHMKKVSSDDTITATEKEEKRRQLQKEIDELNRKLELKKREQEEKAKEAAKKQEQAATLKEEYLKKDIHAKETLKKISSSESVSAKEKTELEKQPVEASDTLEKEEPKHADMPVKEIQEMLSAEYLVQKEQLQKQIDTKAESTIQVVKSEIKQDKSYGADTTKKEAELEALQQKQNFWSDIQKQTNKVELQEDNQIQAQHTNLNQNAKVIIDQI